MYYRIINIDGMWNVFGEGHLLHQFVSEDKARAFVVSSTSKVKDSLKDEVREEMSDEYKDSLRKEVQVENLRRIVGQMEYRLRLYKDDKAKSFDKVLKEFKEWLSDT